jgi:hypothetical protein
MTLAEFVQAELKRLHTLLDGSFSGLTAPQLHTIPAGHPRANAIAWALWHYARTEDNVVRLVLQDRRPTSSCTVKSYCDTFPGKCTK